LHFIVIYAILIFSREGGHDGTHPGALFPLSKNRLQVLGGTEPVRSKYSCGLAVVVVEQPTEPLVTLDWRVQIRWPRSRDRPLQIPPDLVVKCQGTDNAEDILQLIWRRTIVQTSCRHRISWCEPLSPSQVHRFTTKSDGIWEFSLSFASKACISVILASNASISAARSSASGCHDELAFTNRSLLISASARL